MIHGKSGVVSFCGLESRSRTWSTPEFLGINVAALNPIGLTRRPEFGLPGGRSVGETAGCD